MLYILGESKWKCFQETAFPFSEEIKMPRGIWTNLLLPVKGNSIQILVMMKVICKFILLVHQYIVECKDLHPQKIIKTCHYYNLQRISLDELVKLFGMQTCMSICANGQDTYNSIIYNSFSSTDETRCSNLQTSDEEIKCSQAQSTSQRQLPDQTKDDELDDHDGSDPENRANLPGSIILFLEN